MITIQCRDHGGTFQIQPKRGRRPVRCNPENVCTRFTGATKPLTRIEALSGQRGVSRVEATASAIKNDRMAAMDKFDNMDNATLKAYAREHFSTISKVTSREQLITAMRKQEAKQAVTPIANPSIPLAMAIKERLETLGWLCKGRAFTDENGGNAELIATRGDEMLSMLWLNGTPPMQLYSLWYEAPSANGKPAGSLSFNPDECTDKELVRALAGCKVTWWNVLGQKEEVATIAPESIKIEHAYNGHGDETPGDRIVKFIEHGGAGYRAFRMGALLKVG